MREIIYYCDRCHRKISWEEALLNVTVDPSKIETIHLCDNCFSEYEFLKSVHNEEILQFLHGEVFVNEGK